VHDTLVDTSVWVDYFRTGKKSESLNSLIDSHHVVTNDLILTELVPFLLVKGRTKVIKLLNDLPRLPLRIQWDHNCNSDGMSENRQIWNWHSGFDYCTKYKTKRLCSVFA
jgi:predicted nucleic acid-binding protein